jgi:hypothetical protein
MLAVLPAGAQAIARFGFPPYFRVELAWAKLIGVLVLLAPVPARLKEWAYAGFAINLASALFAHLSMGDGPDALAPSAATSVLWGFSYFLWRRRHHASSNPASNGNTWRAIEIHEGDKVDKRQP